MNSKLLSAITKKVKKYNEENDFHFSHHLQKKVIKLASKDDKFLKLIDLEKENHQTPIRYIMTDLMEKGIEQVTAFTIMQSVRKGNGLTKKWESLMKNHGVSCEYIEECKKEMPFIPIPSSHIASEFENLLFSHFKQAIQTL
jgi:hypothetical protein